MNRFKRAPQPAQRKRSPVRSGSGTRRAGRAGLLVDERASIGSLPLAAYASGPLPLSCLKWLSGELFVLI